MFPYIKREFSNFRMGSTRWDSPAFVDAGMAFKDEFWAAGDRVLLHRGVPAVLKVTAQLTQEPRRWNDDPKAPLTVALQGDAVISWLRALEDWALPLIPGATTSRSCIRQNMFAEDFVRARIGDARQWDAEGNHKPEGLTYVEGQQAWVMCSARPYCMSGTKGISIRVIGLQPM